MTDEHDSEAVKDPILRLVDDFINDHSQYSSTRASLVGSLKLLIHRVVRISRVCMSERDPRNWEAEVKYLEHGSEFLAGPGSYNRYNHRMANEAKTAMVHESLVGLVVDFEVVEGKQPTAYLMVAKPGDKLLYRFNLLYSNLELLEDFPA